MIAETRIIIDDDLQNPIRDALAFAVAAHGAIGQVRKGSGEPYVNHPIAVAMLVSMVHHDDDMLRAALLHDVVEDTRIGIEAILRLFGSHVAGLVDELTDKSRPEDGNRAARKAIDRANLAQASAAAQTIKLADLIDNSRSIGRDLPNFAKVYIPEKRLMLDVLDRGDRTLWKIADDQVRAWEEEQLHKALRR